MKMFKFHKRTQSLLSGCCRVEETVFFFVSRFVLTFFLTRLGWKFCLQVLVLTVGWSLFCSSADWGEVLCLSFARKRSSGFLCPSGVHLMGIHSGGIHSTRPRVFNFCGHVPAASLQIKFLVWYFIGWEYTADLSQVTIMEEADFVHLVIHEHSAPSKRTHLTKVLYKRILVY